jgi:tetratricopeptide (TPR) repeat protein
MTFSNERRRDFLICFALVGLTLALYWPVRHFSFLNYDDPDYVSANRHVQSGLNGSSLVWAFTTAHAGNWHPLTWVSHMLDWQIFGVDAGGHHFTNVVLHGLSSALLFLVLRRMTSLAWRSALVAALFAFHPLRVESVAWIAERKDVLSGFFFMLTLWFYGRFAETRSGVSTLPPFHASTRYALLALAAFALGLLSKPMLVTVPFLLLLLDYWPLRRFTFPLDRQWPIFKQLLVEKIPFVALSVVACVLTYRAQREGGAVAELTLIPFSLRLQNGLVSYALYLKKAIWPAGLAVYYPYAEPIATTFALAAVVLLAVTAAALWCCRGRPHVTVGWLWYLGTLVPVIGLVQVGLQAMADRYTYIPGIGLFIALVWTVAEVGQRSQTGRWLSVGMGVAAVVACLALSSIQLGYWQNSETLFRRALAVTGVNPMAQLNLGCALVEQQRFAEAAALFQDALRSRPGSARSHSNLGLALAMQGKTDQAILEYRAALELNSRAPQTHAILASALLSQGKRDEAIAEYQATLGLDPEWLPALNDLAWILATDPAAGRRDGTLAVNLAERLCRLTKFREPQFIGTLAAAYAEAGRFAEAQRTARTAAELADAANLQELAARNRQLADGYQRGEPCRENPEPSKP